jgi:hypothetical protein
MSEQVENLEHIGSSSSNRLPLRKRISPVLKWQPVETPEEHYKQIAYPSQQQQQYPIQTSSSDIVSDGGGDTTETDEEKKSSTPLINATLSQQLQQQSISTPPPQLQLPLSSSTTSYVALPTTPKRSIEKDDSRVSIFSK